MGAYTNTAEELLKQTGPQFLLRTMPSPDVLPAPGLPMEVAEQFFKGRCREGQAAILVHWRGAFYRWQRTCWIETPDRVVRNWLYRFCQKAKYTNDKGDAVSWGPSKRKIGDVLEALQAICPLDDENDQPCWIDERETGVIVSCLNGLLDVEKRDLTLHTSLFFNGTYVPFAYQPSAPKPERWLQFLDALFAKEPAAIDALGEWFGYVISGRTNLHKIMLMVGPSRAGKGVISRILRALIGAVNAAGPTLNSLGTDFGLAPLLGKSLAIISDARFTGKNAAVITERLLSISGEDALTVDRKYRDAYTGRLSCRFHIISNELPRLGDASQAIIGRLVLIPVTQSWYGKEDLMLEPDLHKELPGILNWALDGLARLTGNGGRFTSVPSADEAVETLRDLASPVAAFVREMCVVGPDQEIERDTLYAAYRTWAEEGGYPKSPKNVFGRDLKAAVPAISDVRPRVGGGKRDRRYVGVDLVEKPNSDPDPWPVRGSGDAGPRP